MGLIPTRAHFIPPPPKQITLDNFLFNIMHKNYFSLSQRGDLTLLLNYQVPSSSFFLWPLCPLYTLLPLHCGNTMTADKFNKTKKKHIFFLLKTAIFVLTFKRKQSYTP